MHSTTVLQNLGRCLDDRVRGLISILWKEVSWMRLKEEKLQPVLQMMISSIKGL